MQRILDFVVWTAAIAVLVVAIVASYKLSRSFDLMDELDDRLEQAVEDTSELHWELARIRESRQQVLKNAVGTQERLALEIEQEDFLQESRLKELDNEYFQSFSEATSPLAVLDGYIAPTREKLQTVYALWSRIAKVPSLEGEGGREERDALERKFKSLMEVARSRRDSRF